MSTALIPGWFIEFQAAILRQLPRPDQIDQVTAEGWTKNQEGLKRVLRASLLPAETSSPPNPFLCRLSGDLIIPATDGTETIAQATDVFTGGIDPDFIKWGCDGRDEPRAEMIAEVHELSRDGNFRQIFTSLEINLEKFCWTKHQIKLFCRLHRRHLHPQQSTLFLFKENGEFFVASVRRGDARWLRALVRRFSNDRVWSALYRYRVVVPQLAPVPSGA